jgi:hypothetical protein
MNIQPEPAHDPPLIDGRRERGGTHDTDGFVLSAHRDRSQGRPRTTSSSQLIGYDGLPDRVSQQRPLFPEPKDSRQRRTAVSSPDNAWTYTHNNTLAALLAERDIAYHRIPPRMPKRNGKVERYQQTLAREWAYGQRYRSSNARAAALTHWLEHYNHGRPHSSLGGRPPISRATNLPGQDN